ncbi:TrfB-related DNA-binding protein [Thauera sp.]|uniref:TrfB-related DNA-binding protein n=1 Tax=Thauera sp. TaxID=1905334 RepID=UPI0039E4312D
MSTTLTEPQFAALGQLLRLRGDSMEVARLVLVEGLAAADAAHRVGITSNGAHKAVARCNAGLALARAAVGATAAPEATAGK